MVVLVIHINRVRTIKFECHAPITADSYRPHASILAFELMQVQARQVHVLWVNGSMQPGQDESQFGGLLGLNPCLAAS